MNFVKNMKNRINNGQFEVCVNFFRTIIIMVDQPQTWLPCPKVFLLTAFECALWTFSPLFQHGLKLCNFWFNSFPGFKNVQMYLKMHNEIYTKNQPFRYTCQVHQLHVKNYIKAPPLEPQFFNNPSSSKTVSQVKLLTGCKQFM